MRVIEIVKAPDKEFTSPKVIYICDGEACEEPCFDDCHHTTNICHAKCPNGVYILSDDGTTLWQKTVQEVKENGNK